jgi:copper chaperone CopZ
MERLLMTLPMLYGDHHTTAVRRILEPMDGVAEIFASPSSRTLLVRFYPAVVSKEEIETALANSGYVAGELVASSAVPLAERASRHTAILAGTGESMAFAEHAPELHGRALWPCPGFEIERIPKD